MLHSWVRVIAGILQKKDFRDHLPKAGELHILSRP